MITNDNDNKKGGNSMIKQWKGLNKGKGSSCARNYPYMVHDEITYAYHPLEPYVVS